MLPLRLVLDTNIAVSAALKADGLRRTVLLLAIAKPRLYVSTPIFSEYRTVLSRPELRIGRGLRLQFLQLLKNRAHLVSPSRSLQITTDPADNMLLECPDAELFDWINARALPAPEYDHDVTRLLLAFRYRPRPT